MRGLLAPIREVFDRPLKRYKELRTRGAALITRVADGLPDELVLQAAGDLRLLWKDRRFLSNDGEDDVDFIFDRAIHDIPWSRKRWIEQVCDGDVGNFSTAERFVLEAHRAPVFSLYEIVETRGGGRVRLRDLLRGGEVALMDMGMSLTSRSGQMLALRVVSMEGIHFTSGVAMAYSREQGKGLVENFTWLYDQKKLQMNWDEMMRRYAGRFYLEYRRSERKVLFL